MHDHWASYPFIGMGLKLFSGEKAALGGNLQRQRARQSERWEGSNGSWLDSIGFLGYFRLFFHKHFE